MAKKGQNVWDELKGVKEGLVSQTNLKKKEITWIFQI